MAFAARHLGDDWPSVDDKVLLATMDEWLVPFLHRATSRADLAAVDMEMVLTTLLSWDQQTSSTELVPATLTTAAGRTVEIDYRTRQPDRVGSGARHVRHGDASDDRQWRCR